MENFRDPTTYRIFDYWMSLNQGRPPSAQLLDPVAIPKLMPYVVILERGSRGQFVHRFAGTAVCELGGYEPTGHSLDAYIEGDVLQLANANLTKMLEWPCGRWNTNTTRSMTGRVSDVEYLCLPLCGADGAPDRIMSFTAVLNVRGYDDASPSIEKAMESRWIDLGFGLPADDVDNNTAVESVAL